MLIRSNAFTNVKKHLKGALHCHTTRSDGHGEPQDVIAMHAEAGYDFMSITDHRKYNFKNYAPDVKMTILPGMELDAALPEEGIHCYHIVAVGPTEGNGYAQDEARPTVRVKNQQEMQEFLDEFVYQKNNLGILCHPEWSNTPPHEVNQLTGLCALEVCNSSAVIENNMDCDNGLYWDTLLVGGQKIWGVATDDGHPMDQHCHSWVMVNSENNVDAILTALKEGAFYSTTGPEIYDFYVEDGKAVVECSECENVWFRYGYFPSQLVTNEEEFITHAEYKLPSFFRYVRAVVEDADGGLAWTNPIFLPEEK